MNAKKLSLLLVAVFAVLLASSAYAEGTNPETGQAYGSGGCGLGSYLFGEKTEKHWQILGATTNQMIVPQTYAITSGTSNCSSEGKSASLDAFVETNRVSLADDVARGHGETLAGLSHVIGCTDSDALGKTLQKSYADIFPNKDVDAPSVSRSIRRTIKSNDSLSASCSI